MFVSEFTANILVVGITAIGCVLLIIVVSPQILQSILEESLAKIDIKVKLIGNEYSI